jgi:peptidoglycan/xylan/chitin deacetylase (PgdA/CDA1 family)
LAVTIALSASMAATPVRPSKASVHLPVAAPRLAAAIDSRTPGPGIGSGPPVVAAEDGPVAAEGRPDSGPAKGSCPGQSSWVRVAPAPGATSATTRPSGTLHVPVLMYHHVRPSTLVRDDEPYPDLYVDAHTFATQMAALSAAGWRTITARELAEALRTRSAIPAKTLVITFDDGRPDTYTYAFPILERFGFTATFFIVPGRIGSPGHLTACELQQLAAAGNELADHTMDHVDLQTLSEADARIEIRSAADAIEALVGIRPTTLAYPYGHTDAAVEAAARREGIELAFTTRYGSTEGPADVLDAPRLRIAGVHRLADGTYAGGTTAAGLLWILAPYEAF